MHLKSRNRFPLVFFVPFLLTLFLGAFLVLPGVCAWAGEVAVVQSDVINVRDGPGTNTNLVTQVRLAERLPVLEKSGDWCRVQLSDGRTGWLAGWLVALEQDEAPVMPAAAATNADSGKVAVITGVSVNVRSGPSTADEVIGQAGTGDRLPVLEQANDWYRVQLSEELTGWLAGWLVTLEELSVVPTSAVGTAIPLPKQTTSQSADTTAADNNRRTALVTADAINVRSGPDTVAEIVGQAQQGNAFPVLSQSGDWYRVQLADGTVGWVAGWLLDIQIAQATEPIDQDEQEERLQQDPTSDEEETVPGTTAKNDNDGKVTIKQQSNPATSLSSVNSNAGDSTSIVLKTTAPFTYTSFYLTNPDRLVVDLQGVNPGTLPLVKSINSKSVKQVRLGHMQKDPDVTRLVIELQDGTLCLETQSTDQKSLTVEVYVPNINGAYKGKVVTIDAGHGGSDPGAIGIAGTKEKDITLDISSRVAKILTANGAKVIMARSGDTAVGLYERSALANNTDSDIFVSIHINANENRAITGTSTYIHNGATNDRIVKSDKLAQLVQAELLKALGLRDAEVRSANFAVLRTTDMPAILVEVAFISNAAEEQLMLTESFRAKAAEAIAKGIGMYFAQK